ncbi:MAG: pyridoxal-phosphate dependent enzyme [Alphaproteobacteria bacterium]
MRAPAAITPLLNPRLSGFQSLDGACRYGMVDLFEGCPAARATGRPVSVAAVYDGVPLNLPTCGPGIERFGEWLPYTRFAGLGEGGTPLVALPEWSHGLALESVLLKRESANPSGSHKDRMSPLAVARAVDGGAPGVICASSGNAAISAALYAAAAGIACRIVTTPALTDAYRRLLVRAGAEIVATAKPLDRWRLVADAVRQDGWFPITNFSLPPVGSNPFGVEGYKTIAFELYLEAGPLDAVLVPTSRGDIIWGIGAGYAALEEAGLLHRPSPRLIAVEPLPRLEAVLAGRRDVRDTVDGATRQFSTAGATMTDQALRAVVDSGGTAITVADEAALASQTTLARCGFDLELSSAAAHAALVPLAARGDLSRGERVCLIATASSAREPAGDPLPPLVPVA